MDAEIRIWRRLRGLLSSQEFERALRAVEAVVTQHDTFPWWARSQPTSSGR
jgi:hypothetical protein